ncbi:MAG: hypothetical protein EA412_14760 [Chitinophagaceae bacterium]|nr:MAG: hypothetical protein EA412_14760 [Chitinophagaceae bacterium]
MNKNVLFIIGLLVYALMFVFALLFYKERTIFLDIAYHMFEILRTGEFAIQNYRFVSVISQAFPLTAFYMGLSLEQIAKFYSVGFIVFYFSIFTFILYICKNTRIALCFLLFNTLLVTHTFYWIQSELPKGAAFMFLYLALLDNRLNLKNQGNSFWIFSAILLCIVGFTHPLLLFPIIFSHFFFYFYYKKDHLLLIKSLGLYFLFFIIKNGIFKTEYESGAMFGFMQNLKHLFPNYIFIESNNNFAHNLFQHYYFLVILLIAVSYFYFKNKNYLKLSLVALFSAGYLFLINISYESGANDFYLENFYLLLTVFVALPFVFDILPKLQSRWIVTMIVLAITLSGTIRMYQSHGIYSDRLDWLRNVVEKTDKLQKDKLIIKLEGIPMDTLLMTWGSSYEFWLLSTMERGYSSSIIIEEEKGEFDWALYENKSMITKWGAYEYNSLREDYFIFNDTSNYKKVYFDKIK